MAQPSHTPAGRGLRAGSDRDRELLEATLETLRETGYDRLTVDAVVARARASKATVYRRWPSKARLVVAAFSAAVPETVPEPDTGTLRGDLDVLMAALADELNALGDVVAGLIGEMRRNSDLAAAFEREFLAKRVEAIRGAFKRAKARGELAPGVSVNVASEILPAVLLHRGLLQRRALSRRETRSLVRTVSLMTVDRQGL